jgi:prepilin-type N-terminal cleavage/methylation domain-containing protein
MKKPAFTLLEILISLSLFSVGMVSVLHIFPVNRKYIKQSAQTTQAAFLAEEEIEIVHGTPYASLTILPTYFEPAENLGSGAPSDPNNAFTRTTTVTYVDSNNNWLPPSPATTDTGLKKVTVTVSWSENSITRQYVLSAYVPK